MKIFLDDRRAAPNGYHEFTGYEKCVFFLDKARDIDVISLDYDLGSLHTGYDVLVYMQKNNINPARINIHSSHSFGIIKMESFAKLHFPASQITIGHDY